MEAVSFFEEKDSPSLYTPPPSGAATFFEEDSAQPLDISNLSPEEKVALTNPQTTIDGQPIQDLPYEQKREINDSLNFLQYTPEYQTSKRVTNSQSPLNVGNISNLEAQQFFGLTSPEEDVQLAEMQLDPRVQARDAARIGAAETLTLGFQDEIVGFLNTIQDLASGTLPEDVSFVERYRSHRDLKRHEVQSLATQHPGSYLTGALASSAFLPGPKFSVGAKTITRALKSGRVGAIYGSLFGSGTSEADLTKGEFLPLTIDTTVGTLIGMTAGFATEGIFGALSRGGRRPFVGTDRGQEGAAFAIGSGQGVKRMSDEFFKRTPADVLSRASKAIARAEKEGLIALKPYGLRQPSLMGKPASAMGKIKTGIREQWDNFLDFYYRGKPLDYRVLQTETAGKVSQLSDDIDDILIRADRTRGSLDSIEDIFDKGSIGNMRRFIKSVADTTDDPLVRTEMLGTLEQLKTTNTKTLSLVAERQLLRQLGLFSKFDKVDAQSAAIKGTRNLYFRLRNHINQQVAKALPDEAANLKVLNEKLSDLLIFDDIVNSGAQRVNVAESTHSGYLASTLSDEFSNLPGFGSQFGRGISLGTAGGFGKMIGRGVVPYARMLGSALNQPKMASIWATRIFTSFRNGRINSAADKETARHFIRQNNRLTPLQKTQQIQRLGATGEFDLTNIPDEVREQASSGVSTGGVNYDNFSGFFGRATGEHAPNSLPSPAPILPSLPPTGLETLL